MVPLGAALEGTVPYLVEDYVQAESLDAAIRQYGPAPVPQAMRILAAVAGALDFAAAVNVVHGALHPRDLLVTADDTRVTGLGIGRVLETIGLRAPMRRPYVAPERLQRESWDARADIFSLGALARELLLGRGANREPGAEPRLDDDQASRLQPVLTMATAARPADRFATCLELIGALQDALAGSGVRAASAAVERERAARERGKKREADLLLPLDEPSSVEDEARPQAAVSSGGVGLRLDSDDALVDVPLPGNAAAQTEQGGFADLDLQQRDADEMRPAERFDLSDLDQHLTGDLPTADAEGTGTGKAPLSELAESLEETTAATGLGRYAGEEAQGELGPYALEAGDEPIGAALAPSVDTDRVRGLEPRAEEVAAPVTPYRPAPASERGSRVLPLVLMLLLGIVIGAVAGYLVGVRQGRDQSAQQAAPMLPVAPLPAAVEAQQPAAGTPPPTTPAVQPKAAAVGSPSTGPAAPPAKPPARSASAATCTLFVRSTPRGAAVSVNGQARGVTPLRLRDLAPGRYRVRLTRRGYDSEEREVVLSAARRSSSLSVSLGRTGRAAELASRTGESASRDTFVGSLAVESLPAGARVFVDGRLVGTTPVVAARIPVGSHVVRVDLTGFRPWTSSTQVVAGQRARVTASLERETK